MACRIGITTDPDRRKEEWEREYPDLYGWEILKTCSTKSEAQEWENHYVDIYRCEGSPGGAGDEDGIWDVYIFNY